jgi:hypothetical protein
MTDKEKKTETGKRITDAQRLKYIGFDVFPGKAKDLFKSDADLKEHLQAIEEKRSKGEMLRDHCTLLEERVSFVDRLVLAIASLLIIATLFIPWYSAYTEVVEEVPASARQEAVTDTSLVSEGVLTDSAASAAAAEEVGEIEGGLSAEGDKALLAEPVENMDSALNQDPPVEEMIHGFVAKKRVHKEYSRLSGISAILALGSVGSYLFSSGAVLFLSAILMIVYKLLCIVLPIYIVYSLFGIKGTSDERALKLKRNLKLGWFPVILFIAVIVISFLGADYGFATTDLFTSIGNSYGVGVLFNTLSWGPLLSLGAFILLAVKGIEI